MVTDQLSITFSALADPTRRAILARLTAGAHSVSDLAEPHDMSLPAISKHLKVLERSGLIVRGREAQWRPCQLQAGPLKAAVNWLEFYRRHWEESFDRLDDYLQRLQGKSKKPQSRPVSPGRRPKALRAKTKSSLRPSPKKFDRS